MTDNYALQNLAPAQRFMYEYGCFMSLWSNFELMLEVAIGRIMDRSPRENCAALVNHPAGAKRKILDSLLPHDSAQAEALVNIFEVSARNDWVHGTVLNPNGDFSVFTLLRVKKIDGALTVTNEIIEFSGTLFDDFYSAYDQVMHAFQITTQEMDSYISEIQR
jgi:hypothetical protein